jgi:hypothetical protein
MSCIFWDKIPCSPLKVNRRFGGTRRLHFQGRRVSRARNWRESRLEARRFLARLILRPWWWRWHVPPKRLLTFNGLHGFISHKRELFITTGVRTSDLHDIVQFGRQVPMFVKNFLPQSSGQKSLLWAWKLTRFHSTLWLSERHKPQKSNEYILGCDAV